jgi:hypothetical protein
LSCKEKADGVVAIGFLVVVIVEFREEAAGVIPAQAGIHFETRYASTFSAKHPKWIPACAGMTFSNLAVFSRIKLLQSILY